MADNNERVGKGLELLRDGLRPFVAAQIDDAQVSGALSQTELQGFVNDNKVSLRSEEWDVLALLNCILYFWRSVFSPPLRMPTRDLIGEMKGHRNNWAHQKPFSTDDAYRAVDSALRLLGAVKAEQADLVRHIKADLLRQLNAEQPPKPVQGRASHCTKDCPSWGQATEGPRTCPICGQALKNMWNGWGGIDGHYKKFHQSVTGIPYKQ